MPWQNMVNYNSSYHIKVFNGQVSLSIAIESDFKHAFYGFTFMPLEKYC